MSQANITLEPNNQDRNKPSAIWPALIFAVVAIAGVFYVKWNPYFHKAFIAAAKHSIGASIVSGKTATPPAASWAAALGYAEAYFKAVWQAVVVGLVVGSLVQVLLPTDWIKRLFARTSLNSTIAAGALAVPSMMCTCCAAPVTVGLRKKAASVGSALAYWLANPVLNPATLIFMGFVLSWKFVIFRVVVGLVLVFGIALLAERFAGEQQTDVPFLPETNSPEEVGNVFARWLKVLWQLIIDTIPAYLIVVFVLGAARIWLFPVLSPAWANSVWAIIGLAVAGTLFVIPTAGEIPIVQTMLHFGLGIGPAAALLITLPAVSLPSMLIVKRTFSWRVLGFVGAAVAIIGILSGLAALVIF